MIVYKKLVAVLLISVGLFSFRHASAASIITGGGCSLTNAIMSAQTDQSVGGCSPGLGADTIIVQQDEVITSIPAGDFPDGENAFKSISTPISLLGNNHIVTLSNATTTAGRLFNVIANGSLSISDMTFRTLSNTAPIMENGGFLFAENARVALTHVTVDGFKATSFGGAIFSANTIITIKKSVFKNNIMTGMGFILGGGALYADHGTLSISASQFSHNTSFGQGGALLVIAGFQTLSIEDSSFTDNNAAAGSAVSAGEGTFNATIDVQRVQFDHNTVSGDGGTFMWRGTGSTLTMQGSSFTRNSGQGFGAGIYNQGSANRFSVINSTFSENVSSSAGSAVFNNGASNVFVFGYDTFVKNGSPTHKNTPVFASTSLAPWNDSALENSLFSHNAGSDCGLSSMANFVLTNNLSDDGTCGSVVASGVSMTPALNGGTTLSNALLASSNAIDAALTNSNVVKVACPSRDQRSVNRPLDGNNDGVLGCDIGAYEYKGLVLAIPKR